MRLFGLIGFPLSHSFSKKYFSEKFEKENISDAKYDLFEIESADSLPDILAQHSNLEGLNVTIPHKQAVIPFLDDLDEPVKEIQAVNVIKRMPDGTLKGFNSDYHGFKYSLLNFIASPENKKALVLGTGGASKAVKAALNSLNISFKMVSRTGTGEILNYADLTKEVIEEHQLIINTSPLGMHPKTDTCPDLPYEALTKEHYLFDLVYNPETTLFMQKGLDKGAKAKNGLEMLILQAEKAWEIWNS